jgi:hypothetical protein
MKCLKILFLLFFIINTYLYSQDACDVPTAFNTYPFGFPHVANVIEDFGFALNVSYQGVWSMIGQMNLYYTNLNGDSFLFGVGLPYLMAGINKKISTKNDSSSFYLNFNFVFSDELSGSIGASKFILKDNNYIEIDFDLFYFGGINGDIIIPKVPKSYGGVFNANYIFTTQHFNFVLFAGFSLTSFYSNEVEEYYADGWMPGYSCHLRDKSIWTDFYYNFPMGASITWKF